MFHFLCAPRSAVIKVVSLVISYLSAIASVSAQQSLPDRTFVTNGPVQAVVRVGDTIYIGGRFDRVGPRTGPGVEVALDGSQNPGLPEISGVGPGTVLGSGGYLNAVVADGSGGWFIGGIFSRIGGVPRTNLAHIRADHSVDPNFKPVVNDAVYTLAISGSTVYAAGLFTSVGGQMRNKIAALDATDGSVKPFNPDANAPVNALVLSGDGSIVYVGGRFTLIGGQPRLSIAALNSSDGTATPTFNPALPEPSATVWLTPSQSPDRLSMSVVPLTPSAASLVTGRSNRSDWRRQTRASRPPSKPSRPATTPPSFAERLT